MEFPNNLVYTKDHEWAEKGANSVITVGITDHAQQALGDVVFVELPEVGRQLSVAETFGVVESIKAVSDLYSPVRGSVVEVNKEVIEDPSLINQEPYKKGWLIKIKIEDPESLNGLMGSEDYKSVVESLK